MANTELNALTAATVATGGSVYGEQAGASRKFTMTSFGAILAEAASVAAQRTALGLVIGTDVQAYDADLTTWAGVTPGTGVATALAVNVGSAGAVVLNGGVLGTPSSGTLTNCTGLPISTGVSGLGTGVATALALATSTGGNGAADSGKIPVFNAGGGMSFGSTTSAGLVLISSNTTSCLQLNPSANGIFGMDITSSNNVIQGYVGHFAGGSSVGVVLDFTLSTGSSTAFGADFSGATGAANTGLELAMKAGDTAITTNGWVLTANGAATWTPTANTTAITVASATHTASAPVLTAAQTWNNGAVTFEALKLNVTNTASAAASTLLDLQVGGSSKFKVGYLGTVTVADTTASTNSASGAVVIAGGLGVGGALFAGDDMGLTSTWGIDAATGDQCMYVSGKLGWPSAGGGAGTAQDLSLSRVSAGVLKLTNGANPTSIRVHGDATKYAHIGHDGTNAILNSSSGNLHISSLPTANPGAGILWNNAGTPAIGT